MRESDKGRAAFVAESVIWTLNYLREHSAVFPSLWKHLVNKHNQAQMNHVHCESVTMTEGNPLPSSSWDTSWCGRDTWQLKQQHIQGSLWSNTCETTPYQHKSYVCMYVECACFHLYKNILIPPLMQHLFFFHTNHTLLSWAMFWVNKYNPQHIYKPDNSTTRQAVIIYLNKQHKLLRKGHMSLLFHTLNGQKGALWTATC